MRKIEVICPYCSSRAIFTDSSVIYGRSYGMVYLCANYPNCDAYVGVHKGTHNPLGRMANAELRKWKNRAHAAFDPTWKHRKMPRQKAYQELARRLKIPVGAAHIGMFDVEECKQVVEKFGEQNLFNAEPKRSSPKGRTK